MSDAYIHTTALMGTVVTITVVGEAVRKKPRPELTAAIERAVGWFKQIEETCTRFDDSSELRRLSARVGAAVPVSPILFQLLDFAVKVAEETGGAFDPTVGRQMEVRGFDRNYRTGQPAAASRADVAATYRDVICDAERRTVTLRRPLTLDLGAVAKGFAVDMAARELEELENFSINAGGDVFVAGRNAEGKHWAIGVQHPREPGKLFTTLHLTDTAVCTSGDYERRAAGHEHHLLDPSTGHSANELASVTVIAPTAMMADALATAAFVLGPARGRNLLEAQGAAGLFLSPTMQESRTANFTP